MICMGTRTNRNRLSNFPYAGIMYDGVRMSAIFGGLEQGFVLAVDRGLPGVQVCQVWRTTMAKA